MHHIARELSIAIVFVACMYFGFRYNSGWAFFGAVIAFMSVGNRHETDEKIVK